MMKLRKKKIATILFSAMVGLFYSCDSWTEDRAYSFFVAGHTYGSPSSEELGLYPSFKNTFSDLNEDPLMKRGFLTGDIVKSPNAASWNQVDADLSELEMPVVFAPGNHDLKDYELYVNRYGALGDYFFIEDDLFLIPEVKMEGWSISQNQLDFFEKLVEAQKDRIDHIFVFVHQIIYMDCMRVTPNSSEGKTNELNFESEVLPVLETTNKPTWVFAGDVGAFDWGTVIFHEQMNNVTYIASGMGSGTKDNYLIVDVQKYKSVKFRIVSLQGEDLGKIDDY